MTNDHIILKILYIHYLTKPGNPNLPLNDLCQQANLPREQVIDTLHDLKEKSWVNFNLTDDADTGLIQLTTKGRQAAKDLLDLPPLPFAKRLSRHKLGLGIAAIIVLVGVVWGGYLGWSLIFREQPQPTTTFAPVTPATQDETLILITAFDDNSQNSNYSPADSIAEALTAALAKTSLTNIRLGRIPDSFKRHQLDEVRRMGQQYTATLVIWGYYDDSGIFPRLTVVDPSQLNVVPENPPDKLVNLANPLTSLIMDLWKVWATIN